jgi:hypothetical protein
MSTFGIEGNLSGKGESDIKQATVQDLLCHIINELKLSNKYLGILVGEELTLDDVEEPEQ